MSAKVFTALQNGDAVSYSKNGSVKISPATETPVPSIVTVEYETREGTAKTGKDFRYTSDTLVSSRNKTKILIR